MEHLGPHRTFIDPHDTRGICKVVKSTPIPHREKPLEGTKDMLCPKDSVFLERIIARAALDEAPPPRAAVVMGVLGVLCAAMLLLLPWVGGLIGWLLHEAGKRWTKTFPDLADSVVGVLDSMGFFIVLLCLAGVHLFGIFSYILSKGRTNLGGWAILGLYVGMFVNLVLLHWFQ